ncbi:MAG: hypothetical protein J6W24_06975, partial [Prevotella sp.]|nr:hypothetical protein [Prevotella sp.]
MNIEATVNTGISKKRRRETNKGKDIICNIYNNPYVRERSANFANFANLFQHSQMLKSGTQISIIDG